MAKTTGKGTKGVAKEAIPSRTKNADIKKMGQTVGSKFGAGPVGKKPKGG